MKQTQEAPSPLVLRSPNEDTCQISLAVEASCDQITIESAHSLSNHNAR
jgi:hypothetical protein